MGPRQERGKGGSLSWKHAIPWMGAVRRCKGEGKLGTVGKRDPDWKITHLKIAISKGGGRFKGGEEKKGEIV